MLSLGVALRNITPPPGLPMGGYAARAGNAVGTLDALAARVTVFGDGKTSIVAVALDLLYVTAAWAGPLRRRIATELHTNADQVLIAATHTHAGPAVFGSSGRANADLEAYERQLADTVVGAVVQAAAQTTPITLSFATRSIAGVAANRRVDGETCGALVRALVGRDERGRAVAVLASFGCHPTVLGPDNLHYSRDLFGVAVDRASAALGAPVLLFNGAAADVSTRFTRRAQTPAEVARLGSELGKAIAAAADASTALAPGTLAAAVASIPVRLRQFPPPTEAGERVKRAMEDLAAARERGAATAEIRRCQSVVEGALAQLHLSTRGGGANLLGTVPTSAEVQRLQIAGCQIVGAPGEVFARVETQVCASTSPPTLLVGYANDYLGYLVPPEITADGYEGMMAALDPVSIAAIHQALAQSRASGPAVTAIN